MEDDKRIAILESALADERDISAKLAAEIDGCLMLIPTQYRVFVREGGEFVNKPASLAVSIARLVSALDKKG